MCKRVESNHLIGYLLRTIHLTAYLLRYVRYESLTTHTITLLTNILAMQGVSADTHDSN